MWECVDLYFIFWWFGSSVKVSCGCPHPPAHPRDHFSVISGCQFLHPGKSRSLDLLPRASCICDPRLLYSSCTHFPPFQRPFRAHGRFWSADPAGEEIILIFRAISLFTPNYAFFWVFFLWKTKGLRNASTSPHSAARITLHTFGPGVFNHYSSKPASLSFYHCHNGSCAFVLQSKDDVWYAALSLVISNDNKSALVGPQGNCERWKYAVLMLSSYGNVVSLASCRAYYDDKLLGVL